MKIIGFVSGCFDWMSPGHIRLFKEAKRHCNKLHILMADDVTVGYYKGVGRPLLTYEERCEILEGCIYIDEIHKLHKTQDLSNQFELIKKINPHIYFEGADATDKEIGEYLDRLGVLRKMLNTSQLHISDILRRYDAARYDASITDHAMLAEDAGL